MSLQRVQCEKNALKLRLELTPTSSFLFFCFHVSKALNHTFHSVKKFSFYINGISSTSLIDFVNFYGLTHSFHLLPPVPLRQTLPSGKPFVQQNGTAKWNSKMVNEHSTNHHSISTDSFLSIDFFFLLKLCWSFVEFSLKALYAIMVRENFQI